jgi:xylulokinase
LAAVGAGAFKSVEEACAATIKVVDETPPNKSAKKAYDARFPVYQDLYRALKNDFKQIARLG